MHILVGQEAAKILKVKVEKIWAPTTWAPLDQNECLVPHLKDLIHICLEPEAQGRGMTFNVHYIGSK